MPKRRMPRFERIPLCALPADLDLEAWYEEQKTGELPSAFTLRDFADTMQDEEHTIRDLALRFCEPARQRELEESKRVIAKETDVSVLMAMVTDKRYADAHPELIRRMEALDPDVYRRYLEKFKTPDYEEKDMDFGVKILMNKMKERDLSQEIIALLKGDYVRSPFDFAGLVQILGFRKTEENLRLLYGFYHFFKDNFPTDSYFEGPLLGIANYLWYEPSGGVGSRE
ncbi:MAG: hypothetical protein LBR16_04345 [Treponema sp.]|nr:hypothetical protein [Treponema sp.]